MTSLIVSLALLASWQDGPASPAWNTVAAEGGLFSIAMPGKPEHKNSKSDGEAGMSLDVYIVFHEGSLFIASAAELALGGPARARDPKAFLEVYRKASLKPLDGKLLNERAISKDGAPGLESEAEVKLGDGPPSVMKTRRYLVGSRLVELSVMTPKDLDASKDTAKFFDSFHLEPGAMAEGREWVTFTAIAGRFSVRMPGSPTLSLHNSQRLGQEPRTQRDFEASRDGVSFLVAYFDAPRLPGEASPSERDLKLVLDGLVRETGGVLNRDTVSTLDRQPARDFKIAVPKKSGRPAGVVIGRLAAFEGRVYQLSASGPPALSDSKDLASFLSSFRARKPASRKPAGWSEATVKEGRFTVTSPGKLVETLRQIRTPTGPKPLHDLAFRNDDARVFSVAYSDMDHGLSRKAQEDAHAHSRSRMVEVMHARIVSDEPVALDDEHVTWTMTVELPGPEPAAAQIMRVREYVDDRRVYTVTVMTPKSKDSAADAAAFLNSFRILPQN